MPAKLVDDPLVLFELVVFVTMSRLQKIHAFFSPKRKAQQKIPELVAVGDRNPDIEAALEFYENDLPSPHVVDVELLPKIF